MNRFVTYAALAASAAALAACATPSPTADSVFVSRTSSKSPAELHEAIRKYAGERKWLYIGENKLKGGEVTQVRLCIADAAKDIWTVGMHMAAMMPCGHFGIYREGGTAKVTMLHPRYMTRLDPHPIVQKLADDVAGPFTAMLDDISR